jgi:SAM-dependent methyltransferase
VSSSVPFHYSGTELDSLAEARNYYAWVLRQFEPYLGPSVIEVGAGIGTCSEFLLSVPRVRQLTAIEPAENTYPKLERRFRDDPRVRVLKGYLGEHYQSLSADAFVAVNVLEHVADHIRFLKQAREAIKPGGALLLFVPALPAIYGTLDRAFEHERRYTKRTLRDAIESAGWKPRRISYMNLPGIAAWFMAGRVLRKSNIAARDAKAYDRLVIPWLSRVESLFPPPIGSNLIAIATKP